MKKSTTILVTVATVASLTIGGVALAKRGHGGGERWVNHVSERLELDDSQQQALTTLQTELKETRELMRGDRDTMRSNLQGLIAGETFDQGTALTMITDRTAALNAQAPELVAAAGTFFDSLSVEQKAEVQELMERFGKRRGHGGRDRGNNGDQ